MVYYWWAHQEPCKLNKVVLKMNERPSIVPEVKALEELFDKFNEHFLKTGDGSMSSEDSEDRGRFYVFLYAI